MNNLDILVSTYKQQRKEDNVILSDDINLLNELYCNNGYSSFDVFWYNDICLSTFKHTDNTNGLQTILMHPKYSVALLMWNRSNELEKIDYISSLMKHQILNEGGYRGSVINNITLLEIVWVFENVMILPKDIIVHCMKVGYKCTHSHLHGYEYVCIIKDKVYINNDYNISIDDFMIYIDGRAYNTNWKIYKR